MKQYIEIIRNLRRVAGRKRHLDWFLFGSSAAYNLIGLLPPLATAGIIRMITENNFPGIWIYVGAYFGFYALYFIFMRLNNYTYTKIAEFYHITLQERIFKNVSKHPEVLDKATTGQTMDTYADDIRWVVDGVNVATEAFLQIIRLLIIFGVFVYEDLKVGIIAILVDVLYLFVLNRNAKEEARKYASARRAEDKSISAFSELVNVKSAVAKVQAHEFGILGVASEERIVGTEDKRIAEQQEKMEKSFVGWKREYRRKRRAIANRNTVWAAIPYVGKIMLYILLAKMVIDGTMGLDMLVLLVGYFEMTITCMDKLTTYLLELSNYGVRVERIRKLL